MEYGTGGLPYAIVGASGLLSESSLTSIEECHASSRTGLGLRAFDPFGIAQRSMRPLNEPHLESVSGHAEGVCVQVEGGTHLHIVEDIPTGVLEAGFRPAA